MILEPKCDYFNEKRNDEYAPPLMENVKSVIDMIFVGEQKH